ncbi:hypothetical protein AX774_g788 [Zancudomyces culisetae]|uniref:Uncharacterized protein n=1 Tax=Zancudomyces culisetae TaxID=1213189 RepID=A0A1R1PXE7_ZANCU|nr:hypothetical protein AX774_g788 [Zancudomyces culisetae]|eukprot:OMH85656.1 hypothetical protein AX774_g788 [Zancudomyces culisetae]
MCSTQMPSTPLPSPQQNFDAVHTNWQKKIFFLDSTKKIEHFAKRFKRYSNENPLMPTIQIQAWHYNLKTK